MIESAQKYLSPVWFVEKQIDFEYQKYILLDYVQHIKKSFDDLKLYPWLLDLKFHIQNLESYRTTKKLIEDRIKDLRGFDFEKMTLLYDIPDQSVDFDTVNKIVEYAEKKLNNVHKIGREIWQEVNGNIYLNYVGIIPEYKKEGFVIVNKLNEVLYVYKYNVSDIVNIYDTPITMVKIDEMKPDLLHNYESIKIDIIRNNKQFSSPSVLAADVKYDYPVEETLIPVIKDKLHFRIFDI